MKDLVKAGLEEMRRIIREKEPVRPSTKISTLHAAEGVRAIRAERRALAEAAKSREVAQFLKEMIEGVGPSRALGQDTKMLKEILDKTAERVGKELKRQPEVEAELRNTIGSVYLALGQYDKAEAMHSQALRIITNAFGVNRPEAVACLQKLL